MAILRSVLIIYFCPVLVFVYIGRRPFGFEIYLRHQKRSNTLLLVPFGCPRTKEANQGGFVIHRYSEHNTSIANRLLAALPPKDYERVLPNLEEFSFEFNKNIYKPGSPIRHVFFPSSGIISLMIAIEDKSTFVARIVGKEGMVGLPIFLGVKTSHTKAIVHGNGMAMRMTAADFEKECGKSEVLPKLLRRFAHSESVHISQSAACYRFCPIEKRLARWLLMMSDRMDTNEFPMTHDSLTNMVGVRRETVTAAAGALRKKDLISYNRGNMMILDRPGLEAAACKCYSIISDAEKIF